MIQVYLVPGFFGFSQLGGISYFRGVKAVLQKAFAEAGLDAEIVETTTAPAGSIRRRAIRLADHVKDCNGLHCGGLHFIGHSTGGLDIRLMVTPGVDLSESITDRSIANRTRSVITIATPHFGTPLANAFTDINGRKLLYLLSILAASRPGQVLLYGLSKYLMTLSRLDNLIGQEDDVIGELADKLFSFVTPSRGDAIWGFIDEISKDQGVIVLLTPEGMDLFNAAIVNHPNIHYACIVCAAPPPGIRKLPVTLRNLYQIMTHVIYGISYYMTRRTHIHYPYPEPDTDLLSQMQQELGFKVESGSNDAIVPLWSQVWGDCLGVFRADHLDVVGQFNSKDDLTKGSDWLHSGSAFNDKRFQSLWSRVARRIVKVEKGEKLD